MILLLACFGIFFILYPHMKGFYVYNQHMTRIDCMRLDLSSLPFYLYYDAY